MSETKKPTLAEQHMARCVHFNGTMKGTCAAGKVYEALTANGRKLPCLTKYAGDDPTPCDSLRFPTREEAEAHEAEAYARVLHTTTAIQSILKHAGGKRGVRGTIPCPVCAGPLHYSIAGNNGHVWGTCETKGCLQWMM